MLPMNIEFADDTAVIKITDTGGRISRYRPRLIITRAVEEGAKKVVLDLANLRNIDSIGVSEIVTSSRSIRKQGVGIELRNVQPRVRDIFDVVDLDEILKEKSPSESDQG